MTHEAGDAGSLESPPQQDSQIVVGAKQLQSALLRLPHQGRGIWESIAS